MDRCAILVDAGYLLGAAGTLLVGDADRAKLQVKYAELTKALTAEAEKQTGMPVLRLLWYDGAFDSKPTAEHRALRALPDVKVRLGELVTRAGKTVQKGVDSYLQRDLTTLARNHAVGDAVLIGGDEDLRRTLEEAQDYGMRIHLWGVEAVAPEYNQSQSLIAEADRRWVSPGDWISRFVRPRSAEPSPDQTATHFAPPAQPDTSVAEPAVNTEPGSASPATPTPTSPPVPTAVDAESASPADLARLAAAYDRQRPPRLLRTRRQDAGGTSSGTRHRTRSPGSAISRPPARPGWTTRRTQLRPRMTPATSGRDSGAAGQPAPVTPTCRNCSPTGQSCRGT